MESYFYFGSAGLVLLQIYLSLRKRWYIGTVLPVIMLIVPLAASAVPMEFMRNTEEALRVFAMADLLALVMIAVHLFCRVFMDRVSKAAEKFATAEAAEDLKLNQGDSSN